MKIKIYVENVDVYHEIERSNYTKSWRWRTGYRLKDWAPYGSCAVHMDTPIILYIDGYDEISENIDVSFDVAKNAKDSEEAIPWAKWCEMQNDNNKVGQA